MSGSGDTKEMGDPRGWEMAADAGLHALRIPTPFAVGRVNCYLIEDTPLTLVDVGPNSGKSLDELESGLKGLGYSVEDLELIIVTHQHIDHMGLLEIVSRRSGAEIAALDLLAPYLARFEEDAEIEDQRATEVMGRNGVPEDVATALQSVSRSFRAWGGSATVTRPLKDGEIIELENRSLAVQHRPGHSPSDTCFWDEERKILIAADHLIAKISSNPLLSRPLDGSSERTRALIDYIASLKMTRDLPAKLVLSGHGEPILDHVPLIDERFNLYQRRAEKIYGLVQGGMSTGYEISQEIWGNIAVTQAFLTISEVVGHLDLLVEAGYVAEEDSGDLVRYVTTGDSDADQLGDLIPGGNPAGK